MLGGFLGAGKTTALLRLARRYVADGLRVGIITNDRGEELVDTTTFRTAGFATEEIPRGCFCRRFEELLAAAGRLQDGHRPDVLLAEPVGSGTNLVNTVIKPLKELYANRFTVAPYVALLDPQRAFQALAGKGPRGLSAKVLYLYRMQQNEADIVAINKIDTLEPGRLESLRALVRRNFPQAEILAVSARTGAGFDLLQQRLDGTGPAGTKRVAVDSVTCADADARLGWLNATWQVDARGGVDADRVLLELARRIQQGLAALPAEPAHVKLVLRSADALVRVNLVSADRDPELAEVTGIQTTAARLTVNARVEMPPDQLRDVVAVCVQDTFARHGAMVAGLH